MLAYGTTQHVFGAGIYICKPNLQIIIIVILTCRCMCKYSVAKAIAVSPEFGAADQHDGSEDYNPNCVSDCRDSTMRPGTSRRYVSACKHADAGAIVHACRYYFCMLASYKSWQYNYISKEIVAICIIQPCRLDKHYM